MTLMERLVVKTNRAMFEIARQKGILDEVILTALGDNKEENIKYMMDNALVTPEELSSALNK